MDNDDELGTRAALYANSSFRRMNERSRLYVLYWHAYLC